MDGVANLYFVRESITESFLAESWWYLTVPFELSLRNRPKLPRFGVRGGPVRIIFEESPARARGKLDLSVAFEIEIKNLVPEKREKKRKGKKYARLNFPLTEQSRGTNVGGHFYLPLSSINTTFPCYRSYEIGLEIGGGMQGRRNAKFAPGERREGWWW